MVYSTVHHSKRGFLMLNAKSLWLLVVIIPITLLSVWRYLNSWRIYCNLGGNPHLHKIFFIRHFSKDFFIILSLVLMVLALSDSYWGQSIVQESNSGLEIIFSIDISQSMLAKDAPGERLKTAKTLAQEILFSLKSPNVGVVIFKGEAFTALPLTTDTEIIAQLLSWLNTSWLTHSGTNIADALKKSRSLFSKDTQAERIIVLFSDGEITSGNTKEELRRLFHDNIKVYTVGIGGSDPANVPDAQGNPRINSRGELLLSSLNPTLLKNIAANSNGQYFWSGNPHTLDLLKKALKQNENKSFRFVSQRRSLFNFFVIVAILSLSISQIIRSWAWKDLFGARNYL